MLKPSICRTALCLAAFCLASSLLGRPAGAPLHAALVLHLKLDEASGNTAADSSGNGLNGSIVNGTANTAWVPGVIDNGLHFGASNDYLQVQDHALLKFGTGNFAVAFWINKQVSSSGFSNNWGVNKWNTGGTASEWHLSLNTSGGSNLPMFGIQIEPGTTVNAISPTPLQIGQWHHLAGVRQGDEIRLYMDGVPVASNTLPPNFSVHDILNQHLRVANSHQNNNYTNGIFDDIGIWNNALSNGQVAALYQLANEAALNYDLGQVQQLFALHQAGSGSIEIDGRTWFAFQGLSLGEGGFLSTGTNFFLQLDEFGGGVTTLFIPEPSSGSLLAGGLLALAGMGRRRRGTELGKKLHPGRTRRVKPAA